MVKLTHDEVQLHIGAIFREIFGTRLVSGRGDQSICPVVFGWAPNMPSSYILRYDDYVMTHETGWLSDMDFGHVSLIDRHVLLRTRQLLNSVLDDVHGCLRRLDEYERGLIAD
jgi:hypothetical protein